MLLICGAAILFPSKFSIDSSPESFCAIKLAPPSAAPARIFNALPSDFKYPLITGPGPTYAISIEFENNDSIIGLPKTLHID